MPAVNKYCSVTNGFNFRRDLHENIGHITTLKVSDKKFEADFELKEPLDEKDEKVVGVISNFDWEGGFAQEMQFYFQVSIDNKNSALMLLHTDIKKLDVEMTFNIYEYDKQSGSFFKSLHTNDKVLKGVIAVAGDERQFRTEDDPNPEVQMPENYGVTLVYVPQDIEQEIHMAVSTDKKFVKQWGIKRA